MVLRRRRLCENCGNRFSTHERVLQRPLIIVKKDGRREEFDSEKLFGGILKACNKRPVSTDSVAELVREIERNLRQENKAEMDAQVIGEMVMERLFLLDQVAYVRFASVYQRFDDVRRFAQLLERMTRRQKRVRERAADTSPVEKSSDQFNMSH
jgi:transcriptional repressor NrdR